MTSPVTALPVPPVAAIETGLFLMAVPLLLLMAIWAVVTAVRILIPEAPLPPDPAARTARARKRGEAAPVRLREIVEEQRRRPAPVFPRASDASDGTPDPLADALWARRN